MQPYIKIGIEIHGCIIVIIVKEIVTDIPDRNHTLPRISGYRFYGRIQPLSLNLFASFSFQLFKN